VTRKVAFTHKHRFGGHKSGSGERRHKGRMAIKIKNKNGGFTSDLMQRAVATSSDRREKCGALAIVL